MPRKSNTKSSSSNVRRIKDGRGRPRKFIAPEALLSPEEGGAAMRKKYKSEANSLKTTKSTTRGHRVNPTTGDRHYTLDEVEFMNALAEFKRTSGRLFPSCSEILGILHELGYEKVENSEP